jgi:hydroxymethylglutaryl-CoA reductase (NADPH)
MDIPGFLLKKLYTTGSLKNTGRGAQFVLQNRLSDAELVGVRGVTIDGTPVALADLTIETTDGAPLHSAEVDSSHPLPFPLKSTVTVQADGVPLSEGKHKIEIAFETRPFGNLHFTVEDAISDQPVEDVRLPRDDADDYGEEIIARRRAFIEKVSGARLDHLARYSFDPHTLAGNCENFAGIAQVPIGFAGPIKVCGEHAQGEFMIPMATTEGTMIASYNRGMKVLNMCGGVKVAVMAEAMQRAPVFILRDAAAAREFMKWIDANVAPIRAEAEATSSIARLQYIDPYIANKFVYLRFNFSTGDAAGQNMVGKATFAACKWILDHAEGIEDFFLESNFATDKKASYVNMVRTRGRRVTGEALIPRDILKQHLRATPENLVRHYGVANVGALLSGANNNGLQSANALAAIFIATGQDAANVAESSAGIVYAEMTPAGDLYVSLTIPSLIVASHGGGTGLATQRECLEILGCYGKGKVNKLAEIVCAAAMAGDISLAGAIASNDWVPSHEKLGRNR